MKLGSGEHVGPGVNSEQREGNYGLSEHVGQSLFWSFPCAFLQVGSFAPGISFASRMLKPAETHSKHLAPTRSILAMRAVVIVLEYHKVA